MSSARKLPSGKWMVRKYLYRDADGKDHYKAFTADTRKEAEMKANAYAARDNTEETDLYIKDAINNYIEANKDVLSPSTIRNYRQMADKYFEPLSRYKVAKLTNNILQGFIGDLSKQGLSVKSVKNIYGLLSAALKAIDPDKTYHVKFPKVAKRDKTAPGDDDFNKLVNEASGQLRLCIILGGYNIRRGEICALQYKDLEGRVLHIHKDMVKGVDGWEIKQIPKTSGSIRDIFLDDDALKEIGTGKPDDFIITWTPDSITKRFINHRNKCGLSNIRFHDLRHYYASAAAVIGIPDTYTASMGGWASDGRTMKRVYQNKITSMSDYYAKKMSDHLKEVRKNRAVS